MGGTLAGNPAAAIRRSRAALWPESRIPPGIDHATECLSRHATNGRGPTRIKVDQGRMSRQSHRYPRAAVSAVDMRPELPSEVYARAVALCEWNVRDRVRNVYLTPQWLEAGDRFWYERQLAMARR